MIKDQLPKDTEEHGPHTLSENDFIWLGLLAWPLSVLLAIGTWFGRLKNLVRRRQP